jgi:hypothetical protein
MFRGLINDVKSAAGSLIGKYLARASVAVPFIIALGFATAAGTVVLVEKFGHLYAYLIVSGAFTLLGLLATIVVSVKEQEEVVADTKAESTDTASVAADTAAQAAVQAPLALLGALFASPAGPASLVSGAKMLVRNMPLVVLLALLGLLFWPTDPNATPGTADDAEPAPTPRPNASVGPIPNGLHREAA